ncbi:hypothetical protein Achl_4419 (plasmid) [Pseudarthrobacter chlorophenolicus A6]|uniref:Uncharacterized protein n=1 Tax=Pseudarthrobacter chlorophenolicus (strain ATCC 700700 / DSM 12829 / CIP 107037 / JCM 12360 / KCTC 9906 / NCIMB 13794 / A6) TaxID=452863 RepID=B8HIX3_PSECP|nr:hypothetical protein [Pseudarthrobacter chlorophenolicus]ACL42370.1 hypothetical protein Achl_4419 [Pseudarthrobacter chlorophenolicus A6]SDQ17189.1 hypothetical protein SAMN04489738_0476 [Pseudarthrobacter chlorophenolicus]
MSNDIASSAGTNRVPKGIPTGGQFAATTHAEPTLSLAAERLSELVDVEDFVDIAYTSAAHWQRRYNQQDKSIIVDTDDIAQETMLRTLEALDRGRKITDFRQMVTSTAANVTVRATETTFRAEDRKAYRIFEAQRTEIEAKTGRQMTQREKDELAQKVLDEWHDPRHKPSKDFRIARTFDRSLDAPHGADGGVESTLGATLVNPEQSGHYIQPGSYMDRAHNAMEETGAAHKAEMKRLAWNAIAEGTQVPMSNPGSLSQRQVTKHRGVINNLEGGIMGACRDWSTNGEPNDATEALFAPFGELEFEDQESVVTMLEGFEARGEGVAQTMWESAMAIANNKHSKTA